MRRRLLSLLLVFVMVLGMLPVSAFADAPFTVTVGDTVITDITESTLEWVDWDGNASEVTCYTVSLPQGTTEVTMDFGTEEKICSYYTSDGQFLGYINDDYSMTSSTTHTIPIQDSDNDGVLDGVGIQHPQSWSPDQYVKFVYAGQHQHNYDTVTFDPAPTCITEGTKISTCSSCDENTEGHIKRETVAALGHSYDAGVQTKAPTCVDAGTLLKTCTREGCTDTTEGHTQSEPVAALKHQYNDGEQTKAPTCTENGVWTKTCTREGCTEETKDHFKNESIDALGHEFGEDNKCTRCDAVTLDLVDGFYEIETYEQLLWFANTVNDPVIGQTNINGKLIGDIEIGNDWLGIGTSSKKFAGIFDGDGHTVTFNDSEMGLFNYVSGTYNANDYNALVTAAVVKNVKTAGTVQSTPLLNNAGYVEVTNCVNKANVSGGNNVAGILGNVDTSTHMGVKYSYVSINNCINEGDISGGNYVAGIVGNAVTNTRLSGCVNNGDITGTNYVGGLTGYIQEGNRSTAKIENSYNIGTVEGSSYTGGLVGALYNGVDVAKSYNAGESTYAIAGFVYNNTSSISDTTYYLDKASQYAVPEKIGDKTDKFHTASFARALSAAELSSAALGDAFQASCGGPVLSWQTPKDHELENGVCKNCKRNSSAPADKTLYKVTKSTANHEIDGADSITKGNDYSFTVEIAAGYRKAADFAVYFNGAVQTPNDDGVYTISKDNIKGHFYITAQGIEKLAEAYGITFPKAGNGYRVVPCDGYTDIVKTGEEFKFTLECVDGFQVVAGTQVKYQGSTGTLTLTADENKVYTIPAVNENLTILVSGLEIIQRPEHTRKVKVDITKAEDKFVVFEEADEMMINVEIEVPYFELSLYGLEKYYYNPDCYKTEPYKGGNRETAYGHVTTLHALIYLTDLYYFNSSQPGTGATYRHDKDAFREALTVNQEPGSSFTGMWGDGTNLNYHLNYTYPLGIYYSDNSKVNIGSTSDQQPLSNGDRISIHFITGSASGSAFGFFAVDDDNNTYDQNEQTDTATVKQGDTIKLTHYIADQGNNYTTAFKTGANKPLYWLDKGDWGTENATVGAGHWSREGFAGMDTAAFKTGSDGTITIDTKNLQPGTYYIAAKGAFTKGDGSAGADGFVSNGVQAGPAYFILKVEENPDLEEEEPTIDVDTSKLQEGVLPEENITFSENTMTIVPEENTPACVVLVKDGDTYTRVAATANANGGYNFDMSALPEGASIVVAAKGDVNGDGTADSADAMLISRSRLSETHKAYLALNDLNGKVGDLNGDGITDSADVMLISRSRLSESHKAFKEISWN